MELKLRIGTEVVSFSLEKKQEKYIYHDDRGTMSLDIKEIATGILSILAAGKSFLVAVARDKDRLIVAVEGCRFEFQEASATTAALGEETVAGGVIKVKAPMPGKVVRVVVGEGEKVRKNQTLAIVEAMKMENELKAAVEGVVKRINVTAGELVDSEKTLLELEASP